jgi:CO/xanthine dehydrogenase FAD-binding subunit
MDLSYAQIEVYTPSTCDEAMKVLADKGSGVRIVAGGTEVMVALRNGLIEQNALMDLSRLGELKYIRMGDDNLIHIGALTTLSTCLSNRILTEHAPILAEAISNMASVQVRNLGTIGGNIANGSPAGDTIPPLYAQTGNIVVSSTHADRTVSVEDFFLGPKRTIMKPDELIKEIQVRPVAPEERGFFKRFSLRNAQACSVASVAAWLKKSSGKVVTDARIALGAVAPTVIRAKGAELLLKAAPLTKERLWSISEKAASESSPITDVRATAEYRRSVTAALLFRGLLETFETSLE